MVWLMPPEWIGVSGGTAQKAGMAIRAGRLGDGRMRRMVREVAVAVSPAIWALLRARYAPAPTMSAM